MGKGPTERTVPDTDECTGADKSTCFTYQFVNTHPVSAFNHRFCRCTVYCYGNSFLAGQEYFIDSPLSELCCAVDEYRL